MREPQELLGLHVEDLQYPSTLPLNELRKRRESLHAKPGQQHMNNYYLQRPGSSDWQEVLIITIRVDNPTNDRHWLLNLGWNLSQMNLPMVWVLDRDRMTQGLMVIVADPTMTCIMATDAAAKFVNKDLTGPDMMGLDIPDTVYGPVAQRELDELNRSTLTGAPSFSMEWLQDGESPPNSHLLAMTRLRFDRGGSMMIFHPLPQDSQFFQYSPVIMIHQQAHVYLTESEFDCLFDMYRHMRVGDSGKLRGVTPNTMSQRRGRVAAKFRSTTRDILADIAQHYPRVDNLMRAYSMGEAPTHIIGQDQSSS